MTLVAGIDCSTQSTKALIIDIDDGRVIAQGRAPHVVTGTDGARETDPTVWWDALAAALAATGRAGDVAAIAVGGQQHGLVLSDPTSHPLRPAMLWNDVRSAPQATALLHALGGPDWWAAEIGSVPLAAYTATKWAWLAQHEPHVTAAAAHISLPHDWITLRLTGAHVTDRGDASGTGWWSTATSTYHPTVLDHLGIDPARLPHVHGPLDPAGTVTAQAATTLGLRPGTLVGPGTGDNMAAALGLGLHPGTPVISLGTSGTAYAVSTRRSADPTATVSGFADATGAYLPLACTMNCTQAVDRIASWLGLDRDDIAPHTPVTLLPYLDGERTPNLPHATGALIDLRHDTTPQQILRAAYEGVIASLLTAMDAIATQSGGLDDDAPLILIGGGAHGTAWRDVTSRLAGRRIQIPHHPELVGLGAAVQAAAILTDTDPATIATRWNTRHGTQLPAATPDPDTITRIIGTATRLFG